MRLTRVFCMNPSIRPSVLPSFLPLQPTRVRACQCERGSWVTLAMRCVGLRRVVWVVAPSDVLVCTYTGPGTDTTDSPFDPDTRTLRCVCLVNAVACHYAVRVVSTVSVVNKCGCFSQCSIYTWCCITHWNNVTAIANTTKIICRKYTIWPGDDWKNSLWGNYLLK